MKSAKLGDVEASILIFNDGAKMYVDNFDGAILITPNGQTQNFNGFQPENQYDKAQSDYFAAPGSAPVSQMGDMEVKEWLNAMHPGESVKSFTNSGNF